MLNRAKKRDIKKCFYSLDLLFFYGCIQKKQKQSG